MQAATTGDVRSATTGGADDRQREAWLLETLGHGLWEWDVSTGAMEFSPECARILGYEPSEMPVDVRSWQEYVHPDDLRRGHAIISSQMEAATPAVAVEYRMRSKSGTWRWILCRAVVVERSAGGSPLRLVGMATDVTELKRAEERNRESSRVVSALFDSAPMGIVTLGPDLTVATWNAAAERILGWTAKDAVGRPLPLSCQDEEVTARESCRDILSGARCYRGERHVLRKDGTPIEVRVSTVPLLDSGQRLTTLLVLFEDITSQRHLEAQVLHGQRLEHVARLAGAVAHDFNNLLTVINGYSDIVLACLDAHDPLHESMREIKAAGDRAASLTRQLLAFSRGQEMQARHLDLNQVLRDLDSTLRRLVGEQVELEVVIDPALGPVSADPGLVQQVVANLAVNAREAMPGGGRLRFETANVTLGDELARVRPDLPPGPYVRLQVSDTGTGMDQETLEHLFEPFFTTKKKGQGIGLGLATVYGIVKQSGGHISVTSEVGRGTSFDIHLPLASAEAPAASPREAAAGTETILLVEAEPDVRAVMVEALSVYGYRVLSAAGVADALELARQDAPGVDLLLANGTVAGASRGDLVDAVGKLWPSSRALLMVERQAADAVESGPAEERPDRLQKPFTPDRLARAVRQALDYRPPAGRILIVDDEAEIRKLLRRVLERAGYQVVEASNGRQAVASVEAGGVALVVTDLVMPEQEGIETIRQIRRHHREVKIIAMSGAFGGRFLRTAEMLGADATLPKPVRAEALVRTVSEVLGVGSRQ